MSCRTDLHQASRIPSKDDLRTGAESSLSHRCDPHNQPPPTPAPSLINVAKGESVKPKSPERTKPQQDTQIAQETLRIGTQRFDSIRRRAHRLRPKSWLHFSRPAQQIPYPRSISTQLPKTASTSTVARSVISAPILTSTTNVAVARTEGVHCGEISEAAFSQSTWDSQVGWVASGSQDAGGVLQRTSSKVGVRSPVIEDKANKLVEGTPSKKGRIVRLKNVLKTRIRTRNQTPQPGASSSLSQLQQGGSKSAEDEEIKCQSLRRDLSRRRAETINLYKGKIKGLTGNGHIRRKSVNIKGATQPGGEEDPPLLDDIIDFPTTDFITSSDNESPFGSLTKSFASAVDKLDFYSTLPRNMSFLRSRSSFFSLKKGDKDDGPSKSTEPHFPVISPSMPAPPISQPIAASAQADPPARPDHGSSSMRQFPVPERGMPTISKAQGHDTRRRSGPSPIVFSSEKNGYIASTPIPGYLRGINPLRMHPPHTMAVPPSEPDRSASAMPGNSHTPPNRSKPRTVVPPVEVDTDSEAGSLDDAPIYSPSLGDLSQYSRDTPRSTAPPLSEPSKGQAMNPTPTRSPMKKRILTKGQSRPLKKSKSGISLFSRSKADSASSSEGRRVLNQRDANQKIGSNGEKTVKKSKSLHFGTLFKKDDQHDLIPSLPPSPFQPATPSPLRKVMRYGSQSTKDGSPPLTSLATKK